MVRRGQSRPAPIVRWLALGMLVFDLGVFGWLAWHYRQSLRLSLSESPLESQALSDDNPWKRFSIRHVLWGTTAIALIIAAQLYTKLPLALGTLLVAVCYAMWVAYQRPRLRMQVVAFGVFVGTVPLDRGLARDSKQHACDGVSLARNAWALASWDRLFLDRPKHG